MNAQVIFRTSFMNAVNQPEEEPVAPHVMIVICSELETVVPMSQILKYALGAMCVLAFVFGMWIVSLKASH